MQPLISPVDHESRHNSHLVENSSDETPSENTPLLQRFPQDSQNVESHTKTWLIVGLLLLILLVGVFIGIYLLIVQNNSENILPPVELPLKLVSRTQWSRNHVPLLLDMPMNPKKAKYVIIVQTDTKECYNIESCKDLLHSLELKDNQSFLPYNFLISSNGETYEGLGWRRPSSLFSQHYNNTLVVAFIGNFTRSSPSIIQLQEAKVFFDYSVSQKYLESTFVIIGKVLKYRPIYLFNSLKKLPQWNDQLSDL